MVVNKFPQNPIDCHILALEFMKSGELDKAIAYYKIALSKDPQFTKAYVNLGVLYKSKGKLEDAIKCFKKAIKIDPKEAPAYSNLGNIYWVKRNTLKAKEYFEKALNLNSELAEANNNLGVIAQMDGNHEAARQYYQKAIKINPEFSEAVYSNLGSVLIILKETEEALNMCKKAVSFVGASADSYFNLGNAYGVNGDLKRATQSFEKALKLDSNHADALNSLVEILIRSCRWDDLDEYLGRLDQMTIKAISGTGVVGETPFTAIMTHDDPKRNLQVAKAWSKELEHIKPVFSFDHLKKKPIKEKLRIGYVSSNFSNHPIGHIIKSMFSYHDRNNFEIYCYDYSLKDKHKINSIIRDSADYYRNITDLNLVDTARLIYKDKINILVDLMGYTKGNRLGIFAYRSAPIQITYLGFPGSLGASFIDYNIVDRIVVPKPQEKYYSEKLIFMPGCYQVNDFNQVVSDKNFKRDNFGLPKKAFVFCSFNRLPKITKDMFNTWMNILKKVPGSVLWLQKEDRYVNMHLRKEAKKRGIEPKRLIFSGNLALPEHLKRLPLADLMLDTYPYTGGATTSHALRMRVPVVSLAGKSYLSRMGASLLTSVGLPELISHSFKEYEDLAVDLGTNANKLENIETKLTANLHTCALFNTELFVGNLEQKYQEIWSEWLAGPKIRKSDIYKQDVSSETVHDRNLNKVGIELAKQGKYNQAIGVLKEALKKDPSHYDVYFNLGMIFDKVGKDELAIKSFEKGLKLYPNLLDACTFLYHLYRKYCIWDKLPQLDRKISKLTFGNKSGQGRFGETPLRNLIRVDDPKLNKKATKVFADDLTKRLQNLRIELNFTYRSNARRKIRLGYFGSTFRNHPVGHLISGMFAFHDRRKFEVYLYSSGADDESIWRKQAIKGSDKFVDVNGRSSVAIAKTINEDEIDILIDLTGFSDKTQLGVAALRPAPVIMTYLGFPGTTATDFVDYNIVDRIVVPPSAAKYYSEKLIYLPCYQVQGYSNFKRVGSFIKKKKKGPIVFCSFNRSIKITPEMFDVWMKILKKVPNSVLWLSEDFRKAKQNLVKEARKRGVTEKRLVFHKRESFNKYLRRLRKADIALDTFHYSGGATTSNLLWLGVPVITKQGKNYLSRMSSSLLTAVGLPELITHSFKEYEKLAVDLATNPKKLNKIRSKLLTSKKAKDLFDTKKFVRNLEIELLKIGKR